MKKKYKVKLFVSDIDGTLTDGTVYQLQDGQEMKRFHSLDGAGFHILKNNFNIKIIWMTSESLGVNYKRYEKLKKLNTVDSYIDNIIDKTKMLSNLCIAYNVNRKEIAFIGNDLNDIGALVLSGYKACPADANYLVKKVKGIKVMKNKGGYGAVREFIDWLIKKDLIYKEK